jgi:hypothetical protein
MRRVIASRTIDRQSAIRNTALKKAPRISARSHCSRLACSPYTPIVPTDPKRIFVS